MNNKYSCLCKTTICLKYNYIQFLYIIIFLFVCMFYIAHYSIILSLFDLLPFEVVPSCRDVETPVLYD